MGAVSSLYPVYFTMYTIWAFISSWWHHALELQRHRWTAFSLFGGWKQYSHDLLMLLFRTCAFLLRHLSRMASLSERTGMTCKNLAIVWAPNLLRYIVSSERRRNWSLMLWFYLDVCSALNKMRLCSKIWTYCDCITVVFITWLVVVTKMACTPLQGLRLATSEGGFFSGAVSGLRVSE